MNLLSWIRTKPHYAALILVTVALLVVIVETVVARTSTATTAPTVAVSSSPTGVAAAMPTPVGPSTPAPSSAAPTVDDGAGPGDTPATGSPVPGQLAAAQDVAERFAAAWLNTTNKSPDQWRADLASYITPELANQLATADPGTVPVGQIGAPVTVTPDGDHLAHVKIPITTGGTLTVTVILGARPAVSDIDWAKP